jgi:hypothetical protein
MISGAQFGKFTRSRSADEEQYTRALTLCFVDAERGSAPLAAGRNSHQELTWTRHIDDRRSVKTKEEHAGRELRCIRYTNFMHCRHRVRAFSAKMRHTAVTQFLTKPATFD